jgi:hypothetical protein
MWSSLAIFELPPCILKEDLQETHGLATNSDGM